MSFIHISLYFIYKTKKGKNKSLSPKSITNSAYKNLILDVHNQKKEKFRFSINYSLYTKKSPC
jgi:hypothetical protein